MKHIVHDMDFCKKLSSNGDYHFLLIAENYSTITAETLEYSRKNMDWASSISMVSKSLAHRILFNLSVKFMVDKPAKMHKSKEDALEWIDSIRNQILLSDH
ncbi:MAG: hypothetical protein JKY42_01640 [Flavobacteriales bacterium]|nr:hypothetical protein [Flavobacteriales bacterium]